MEIHPRRAKWRFWIGQLLMLSIVLAANADELKNQIARLKQEKSYIPSEIADKQKYIEELRTDAAHQIASLNADIKAQEQEYSSALQNASNARQHAAAAKTQSERIYWLQIEASDEALANTCRGRISQYAPISNRRLHLCNKLFLKWNRR